MLLENLFAEYLLECQIRKFTPKTIKGYRNCIELLVRYCKEKHSITKVKEVSHLHIRMFFKELIETNHKESYINTLLKSYRAFFKYAIAEEYIDVNPCDKVRWVREETPIIETFTDKEVKGLIKAYNDYDYLSVRNKTIICMLVDTGIRCNEMCILPTEAVKEDVISIFGKGKKYRQVALSPYLEKMLLRYQKCKEAYFKYKNVPDNLFLSRTGRPLTVEAVERIVRTAGETANVRSEIRCSPHTCRHYFAQSQLRNGMDVYSLSRVMGHNSISITQRYLNSLNDSAIVEKSVSASPLMSIM